MNKARISICVDLECIHFEPRVVVVVIVVVVVVVVFTITILSFRALFSIILMSSLS